LNTAFFEGGRGGRSSNLNNTRRNWKTFKVAHALECMFFLHALIMASQREVKVKKQHPPAFNHAGLMVCGEGQFLFVFMSHI
jgi:hypothetical protein